MDTSDGVLDGVRVVDLGGSVACLVAGLLLAEAGAEVVLVEPPGGSPFRDHPGFRTWGRSKRCVQLDIADPAGAAQLDGLLAGADAVLHSYSPAVAAGLGLSDAALADRHPHLVVASVLGWPANHADAGAPVDDHLTLARLGVLDEQIATRRDGPIYVRFPLGTWPAAWLAVIGVLSRLLVRERTGSGGAAHTSLAQGALVPMMMHWSRSETPSPELAYGMPKHDMRPSLFECSDGRWIHLMPPPPDSTPLVVEVFAEMGPERVAAANARHAGQAMDNWRNWGALIEAFKQRPSDAWLANMWAHDVPAQPAVTIGEILGDAQARANAYVVDLDDADEGTITVPGLPLTLQPPARVRHPAQVADAARRAPEWEPYESLPGRGGESPRYPLEGLKVVDFGNFLAGPLGPMLLADLGATVVKVESITGDPMRRNDWPFVGCQRGKRSVALDLKSPASRPTLEALLRWADVVHHNLRLPAARRLGLDRDSVRAVNPDVVFCHVSSYGPAGERADWPGYDQMFQAACGWEVAGAGDGNPPMWHRFGFMDHLCAMSSAAATLMALYRRELSGTPGDVAASLLGAGVLTNSETFMRSDGSVADVARLDSRQLALSLGDRLAQTSDGWVAIAARTPSEVAALVGVLAADSPEAVEAALACRPTATLVAELTAAGVPAAAVRLAQNGPFFDDPDHRAAGMVAGYPHPQWGHLEQPGAPWWFGDLDVRLDRAPPLVGQHTREVLLEVGVDASALDELVGSGVAVQAAGR